MSKSSTVEDYKLVSSYESVKQTLLQDRFSERLRKPLEYWVLPNDRRLPLAFLQRTLDDLLATPFEELSATPGIGQKKISSLVKLLQRATRDEPPAIPFGLSELTDDLNDLQDKPQNEKAFDPSVVSEALWADWCKVVQKFNIGDEKLGRLAPSLSRLPTVIWHTPMKEYLDHSVNEIRQLRTHGEKRVRCVLEVFHSVYQQLTTSNHEEDLTRQLTPTAILQAQDWVAEKLVANELPSGEEIRNRFVIPLLEQIKIDSGETVYSLAAQRLGISGEPQSVREQSRSLGVTRARVYQLLDDCSKVLNIRWPDGKVSLDSLTAKFATLSADNQNLSLFYGIRELCYPEKLKESGVAPSAPSSSAPSSSGLETDDDAPMNRVETREHVNN